MQELNATSRDFLRRTDTLAVKLGVDVGDLPGRIGISRASLFRYRSGKSPISAKAWIKLAFAETDAGIETPLVAELQRDESEDEMDFLTKILEKEDWTEDMDAQLLALMGQGLLGQMVVLRWSILKDCLAAFLEKVEKSAKDSKNLHRYSVAEIPQLRKQMKVFEFQLELLAERVAQTESDGSECSSPGPDVP